MTQPLHPGGLPSLSLGAGLGHEPSSTAAAPIPSGRNIASLRAPRGTNFIRLAFAAMFLLGFLGLVGFLLKDYLPDIFPNLAGHDDAEEIIKDDGHTPTTATAPEISSPGSGDNSLATTAPVEGKPKPTPMMVGFDPTEPVSPQAQPVPSGEIAAVSSASSPQPSIASALPTDTVPKMPSTPDALLEVPSKSVVNTDSDASKTISPPATLQANTVSEDDAPPEAKPAVEALKKFLTSTSLSERLQYTLGAEHMKPLMERYYTRSADGPVIVDRIQFVRMDPNPELGSGKHCIFSLENKAWEFPVPVMLEEQPDGFKVDWLAFVEFKDRLLEKFFQAYQEGPARFHVGIIRHHYFEDGVPNVDHKDAFRVSPAPPNAYQASVFLDKDSALAQELRVRLPWETHVWAVVELEWKKLGSQQWVELSAVPQMHWYSLPMGPRPISTPQKALEVEELPPGISKNGVRGKSTSKSGSNMPPPGIQKSSPNLPPTIKRPLPAGR